MQPHCSELSPQSFYHTLAMLRAKDRPGHMPNGIDKFVCLFRCRFLSPQSKNVTHWRFSNVTLPSKIHVKRIRHERSWASVS